MIDALGRALLSLEGLSVAESFGEQLLHAGPAARVLAREHHVAPVGRQWMWTDDTAMAISIVEELRERGSIDPGALALRFARRYMAEPARGYGGGAHKVLSQIAAVSRGIKHRVRCSIARARMAMAAACARLRSARTTATTYARR